MTKKNQEHYDVGIVGVSFGANFGSVLTYYSLYKTIESFGKSVLMVSKIGASANDPEIQDTHAMRFAREHYNWSKVYNHDNVGELNDLADTFVVGSDQVWNYGIAKGFGDAFYLGFANDDKRKVSYAPSFGHVKDFSPAEEVPRIAAMMKRFNAISVREDSGTKIARDVYGVPARQVAEPIYLTDAQHYRDLAEKSKRDVSEPYLLAYILDPTPAKKAAIEHIASKLNLKPRIILDAWPHLFDENKAKMDMDDAIETDVDAYDFLKLYTNASYVITDSFHGTSFALKFEKPFASIGNKRRGLARFDSLFRRTGHRHRFTLEAEEIVTRDADFLAPMDYETIRTAIDRHVDDSKAWLKASLEIPAKDTIAAREPKRRTRTRARRVLKRGELLARSVKARVAGQRFTVTTPKFEANNQAWTMGAKDGVSELRVAGPGYAEQRGNFVWTDLPAPLREGAHFELLLDWLPRTESRAVNVHLRNPETGKFRVVGAIDTSGGRSERRTDRVAFRASEAGLSQVMFGAMNFKGRDGGADIARLSVRTVTPDAASKAAQPSFSKRAARKAKAVARRGTFFVRRPVPAKAGAGQGADRAPRPDSGLALRPKPTTKLAIPDFTPDRRQRVLAVRENPQVQEWKNALQQHVPSLTFYVGRELKEYTNNKVGGPADILAFPTSVDEAKAIVDFANEQGIGITALGLGSNVLVRDGGIRGIVILTTELKYFSFGPDTFTAGAGAKLIEAAFCMLDHERSGLEWAAGIPGTVGGGVYMNAGTYTSDVRSNLKSVTVMDGNGEVFSLEKDEINWGVRYTTFQDRKDWLILEATFNTTDGVDAEMAKKMVGTVQARENSMPMESPNHGSTFKWYRAPRLIQQAGLVGTRIGGAKISEKQPGFIINVKQATASDYEALINYTIARVYAFSGFMLEPEVEIIGELPHRYKRYPKDAAGHLE